MIYSRPKNALKKRLIEMAIHASKAEDCSGPWLLVQVDKPFSFGDKQFKEHDITVICNSPNCIGALCTREMKTVILPDSYRDYFKSLED